MRVLINTAKLRFGGAVQVALSFIYECRQFKEHEYHVFLGTGVGRSLREEDFPDNFYFYRMDLGSVSLSKIPAIASKLTDLEIKIKPDCVVTTSGPSYWKAKVPHLMGFNLPNHIYYDSPFYKSISTYRKVRFFFKRKFHFWFFRRDASAYIVQTDDVNQRLRKALKTKKVYTVSNTHSSFFNNFKDKDFKLPAKQANEYWFITISSYYKHKNLEIIPSVIKELQKKGFTNCKFILTLPPQRFEQIVSNQDKENIYNVGPVKPEYCPAIYNKCDFMFLPTLVECFSASYPEAMVMKKPIITTDLPFAHSICKNAAVFFKPMDAKSAADTIIKVINDDKLKNELIEQGLIRLQEFDNAAQRADKILKICKILVNGKSVSKETY
jgi:glycosyltransferase involved in cell wall biosynthesis